MKNRLQELLTIVEDRIKEVRLDAYRDFITVYNGDLNSYLDSDSSFVLNNDEEVIKESLKEGKVLYDALLM